MESGASNSANGGSPARSLTPTRIGPRDVVPELLAVPRVVLPLVAGGVHDLRSRVTDVLGGLPLIGGRITRD